MPLHRLTRITIGVPNLAETAAYYEDFGLTPADTPSGGRTAAFATVDGGEQLTLAVAARRRLLELGIGVDDPDDLDRVAANVTALGLEVTRTDTSVQVTDPGTDVRVNVEIAPRIQQQPALWPGFDGPGVTVRATERAPGVLRVGPVRPRKLGHVVVGSTDQESSHRFFTEGIGFKVSDRIPGVAAFMRCSTDHHNVMIQRAPVTMLHHTSWQVEDVDEIGRGATALLDKDPGRHVWGLGGITSAPTSSGTSRTRPATSLSTTPTWTASWTTHCGRPGTGPIRAPSTAGVRPRRRRSSIPRTSPA